MSEALVIWTFIFLVQQAGMVGGAGADKESCLEAREQAMNEMKAMGQQIIAASDCTQLTLEPVKP